MNRSRLWRLGLPTLALAVSLVALASACLIGQEAAKAPPSGKGTPFPLSVFAQAKKDDFIGEKECAACHPAPTDSFNRSPHALFVRNPQHPTDKQGCEACHGPGGPHLAHMDDPATIHNYILNPTRLTAKQASDLCLRCHQDIMAAGQWRRTAHGHGDVRCSDCHYIHKPDAPSKDDKASRDRTPRQPIFAAVRETGRLLRSDEATVCGRCHQRQINEFRQSFHHPLPEGRVVCSDCHELHPTRKAGQRQAAQMRLRGNRDVCVTCHAENAGPFVYEHDPVAGWTGDGCTECHKPHGSHNPRLLNSFSRGLCFQCHTDKAINHNPGLTCWDPGCHNAVHGSNRDRFLRVR